MNSPAARPPAWRLAVAVCALAAALALSGSPAYAGSDTVVWEGDDQAVRLAPQDGEAAPPNDHPVILQPRDIQAMLASLRFRYADQDGAAPAAAVFNDEQVEILGRALARGLTRAQPSQDVTFSVVGAHRLSPGAFARRIRLTAGRAFFREGSLNLILGEIQSPYRKKNIYGRIDQDFHPREFGSRRTPGEHGSVLIASASASLHQAPEGNGTRNDWIVFDPDGGVSSAPAPTAAPAPVATSRTREATAAGPDAADTRDIEQRLETLKRLREKDLISEDAYRQRVDEILREL